MEDSCVVDITEPFWYLVEIGDTGNIDESEAYGFIANVPDDHLLGIRIESVLFLHPIDGLPRQISFSEDGSMFVFCSLLDALYGMHDVISANDAFSSTVLLNNIEKIVRVVETTDLDLVSKMKTLQA
jgi:hypothetical protein